MNWPLGITLLIGIQMTDATSSVAYATASTSQTRSGNMPISQAHEMLGAHKKTATIAGSNAAMRAANTKVVTAGLSNVAPRAVSQTVASPTPTMGAAQSASAAHFAGSQSAAAAMGAAQAATPTANKSARETSHVASREPISAIASSAAALKAASFSSSQLQSAANAAHTQAGTVPLRTKAPAPTLAPKQKEKAAEPEINVETTELSKINEGEDSEN